MAGQEGRADDAATHRRRARSIVIRVSVALAVLAAGCGGGSVSTSSTVGTISVPPANSTVEAENVADDSQFPTDEELVERERRRVGPDLAVTVNPSRIIAAAGDTVTIVVAVTSLDTTFVNAPAVVLELPTGVTVISPLCEDGAAIRCPIAPALTAGSLPASTPEVSIRLAIDDGTAPTDLEVSIRAVAFEHDLDNDPNPGDNIDSVTISVS